RRLFLRGADDLLGLFARFREHPVSLLIHAPRLFDLFGDRDAKLVDEIKDGGLLEDDLAGHRDLPCVDGHGLEPFHEELDVQGHPPPPAALYRRNTRSSSPICFTRTTFALAGGDAGCFRSTRAMTVASGASAAARFACASVASRTATSAKGGSTKTKSYCRAGTPRSRKPMTFAATTSERSAKPVTARFFPSASRAGVERSTNVACAAPRDNASMPRVPAPAKRSSTRASPRSGSRIAKSVSRMRSVAGRVPVPF